MQNRFFAMLARMKLIRRWGLMFSTRDENLSEHSLDTAFFMHALLSLHNRRVPHPRGGTPGSGHRCAAGDLSRCR